MTNERLRLSEVAAYLTTALAPLNGLTVCTSMKRNFITDYGRVYPAVWVRSSRYSPDDDGQGYSGHWRQHGTVIVTMTLVVQRYNTGNYDPETELAALHDRVCAAMLNYQPTRADIPFALAGYKDGDEAESVASSDLAFQTKITYEES